jgi:ParB/RepB/Spo0J family partition protein
VGKRKAQARDIGAEIAEWQRKIRMYRRRIWRDGAVYCSMRAEDNLTLCHGHLAWAEAERDGLDGDAARARAAAGSDKWPHAKGLKLRRAVLARMKARGGLRADAAELVEQMERAGVIWRKGWTLSQGRVAVLGAYAERRVNAPTGTGWRKGKGKTMKKAERDAGAVTVAEEPAEVAAFDPGAGWPVPNEHGVYPEEGASGIDFKSGRVSARVLTLEVRPGCWLCKAEFLADGHGGCGPLSEKNRTHGTRAAALAAGLREVMRALRGDADNGKAGAMKVVRWAEKELARLPATGTSATEEADGAAWTLEATPGRADGTLAVLRGPDGSEYRAVEMEDSEGMCVKACCFADGPCPAREDGVPLCFCVKKECAAVVFKRLADASTGGAGEPAPSATAGPETDEDGADAATRAAERTAAPPDAAPPGEALLLDPGRIAGSPFQTRGRTGPDGDGIRELAESIKANGLLQRLVVRPLGGGNYELVAGHRRLAAWRAARPGEPVPCDARDMTDAQAETALNVENLQRKNLTPLEEADGVARLLGRGHAPAAVAAMLGVSERFVARRRAMARLPPAWRAYVAGKGWGPEIVELAARLPEGVSAKVLYAVESGGDPELVSGRPEALRALVAEMEHRLSAAPWAERHGEWCRGCAKRSDAEEGGPDLFGGGDAAPDGSPDARCMDPECWGLKLKLYVREQRAELRHAHGAVLEAKGGAAYTYAAERDAAHPVPVLITDGPEAGMVRWAPKPQAERRPKPPSEKDITAAAHAEAVFGLAAACAAPDWPALAALASVYGVSPSAYGPAGRGAALARAAKTREDGRARSLWSSVKEGFPRPGEVSAAYLLREARQNGELAAWGREAEALEALAALDAVRVATRALEIRAEWQRKEKARR